MTSANDYGLLLCTNGGPDGLPALDYGAWLAAELHLPVTLLGIVESPDEEPLVRQALQTTQAQLDAAHIPHTTRVRAGRARRVICAEAVPQQQLVVLGPMGRPPWRRWLRGSAFRRMMPDLPVPFIYTATAHRQLARILVCTGALDHAISAENCALELARRAGAAVTILHVVEPPGYHYPTADEVEAHWDDLLTTDTPQARHLRAFLARAEARGVIATLKLRHGPIMPEIIAQARAEPYDLVVTGSKHSSRSLRRQYLPDVSAGVAETLRRPVLVVRAAQRCPLAEEGRAAASS